MKCEACKPFGIRRVITKIEESEKPLFYSGGICPFGIDVDRTESKLYSMNDEESEFRMETASEKHAHLSSLISKTMEESAYARGTGIAKRSTEELAHHILEGNGVIAIHKSGAWAGFCYLAVWENGLFVSNSGLIVASAFRNQGVAKQLKTKLFELSRKKYPKASIVGITTSVAVMKVNTSLGFYPTAFSEITKDEKFWEGCGSCANRDILQRTGHRFCLCTAMRYNPVKDPKQESKKMVLK